MNISEFTEAELRIIPEEDLLLHVAKLRKSYLDEAIAWMAHRDNDRVDSCFARYQAALSILKERCGLNPVAAQARLDEIARKCLSA